METKNLAEDPYEKLANAIIVQVSKDYMTNLRKEIREVYQQSMTLRNVNDFFVLIGIRF